MGDRENAEEQLASRAKVNEDRNPQIDAAIVRVMKARRSMEHNNLIAEVTKQLQVRSLTHTSARVNERTH